MEWQPIETVPKDGTHILLFYPGGRRNDDSGILEAYWPIHDDFDPSWRGPYSDGLDCELRHCVNVKGEPTHWMPLPAPPAQGIVTEGQDPQGLGERGE